MTNLMKCLPAKVLGIVVVAAQAGRQVGADQLVIFFVHLLPRPGHSLQPRAAGPEWHDSCLALAPGRWSWTGIGAKEVDGLEQDGVLRQPARNEGRHRAASGQWMGGRVGNAVTRRRATGSPGTTCTEGSITGCWKN
jgi:hypothetical protein